MDQWKASETESSGTSGGFFSLMTLTRIVIVLVGLRLALQVSMTAGTLILTLFFPGVLADPDVASVDDAASVLVLVATGLAGVGMLGAMLLALPFWLAWHYQAGRNLEVLGREDLAHGPVGHAGWWFVPFANLIMPYRCMQELYIRSQPGDEMAPPPELFSIWWGCWLGSNIASNLSNRLGEIGVYLDGPAVVVGAFATVLYLRWLWDIAKLQEQAHILETVAE